MQKLSHSSIEPMSFYMKWDIMTMVDGDKYVNKTLQDLVILVISV